MALSKLASGERPAPRKCQVCVALADLPPKEAAALKNLLADPQWRYDKLSEALADDEDYPLNIHPDKLGKHARGNCGARDRLR